MQSIQFSFKPSVSSKDQEEVLAKINARQDVIKAAHLKPEAQNPEVQRMAFAYLDENVDPQILLNHLSTVPEIDSVSLPSPRRLIF